MNSLEKYYQILELNHNATQEEIKKAYRKLAKKWHPDNHHDNEEQQKIAQQKFIHISEAYQILLSNQGKDQEIKTTNSTQEVKVKTKAESLQFYYNLGVEAAQKENWTEAVNYFSQVIKIDDTFREAYFYRGIVLEKQGFALRAKNDFNKFKSLQIDRLNEIWSKVIDNLQYIISKQLCYQGLKLVSLNQNVAVLRLTNQNLLVSAKEKQSDFERAFTQVCGHPIKVIFDEKNTKYNYFRRRNSANRRKSSSTNIGKYVIAFLIFILSSSLILVVAQRFKLIDNPNNEGNSLPSSQPINN